MKAMKAVQMRKEESNVLVIGPVKARLRGAPPAKIFANRKRKAQLAKFNWRG